MVLQNAAAFFEAKKVRTWLVCVPSWLVCVPFGWFVFLLGWFVFLNLFLFELLS